MKGVMYHYVRPSSSILPNLKHLHIQDFVKQLDFFEKNYGFVTKDNFQKALLGNYQSDEVILTFDDGLSCHYDFVFPELKKRGLWGIFYIPTEMYQKQKLLDVHRIHLILAAIDSHIVYELLKKLVNEDMLIDEQREEFRINTYNTHVDEECTKLVKRILNYYIGYQYRESIIDKLVNELELNSLTQVKSFYLSSVQMLEMQNNGMVLGSHSSSHPVMSKLSKTEQMDQVVESFDYLYSHISHKTHWKTFCFPYGGAHSYNQTTLDILESEQVDFSFDVCSRDISVQDLLVSRQTLPRFDCNEFPFGQVRMK